MQQPIACYKVCEVFAASLLFTGIAHEVGQGAQGEAGHDMQNLAAYAGWKFRAGQLRLAQMRYCICARRGTWQQL